MGTRRLYLARNYPPPPPPRRKGGCSYPGPGRQGRDVGASFSAVPGPTALGAAFASAELEPPADWVEGDGRGCHHCSIGPLTPRKGPSKPEALLEINGSAQHCPPQPFYGEQGLDVLWRNASREKGKEGERGEARLRTKWKGHRDSDGMGGKKKWGTQRQTTKP